MNKFLEVYLADKETVREQDAQHAARKFALALDMAIAEAEYSLGAYEAQETQLVRNLSPQHDIPVQAFASIYESRVATERRIASLKAVKANWFDAEPVE